MSIPPLSKSEECDLPVGSNQEESRHAEGTIERVAVEDPIDFDTLYGSWFDEVSKWIRALGGPEADRDDLVQEIFIVVHRRLKDFDGKNLAGWLYQITRRKVRDFRRLRWAKRLVLLDRDTNAGPERTDRNPLASVEFREEGELLMRLLEQLNESERAAVVLFEIEGYSGERIAQLLSVPLNTVWTRIHKARHKLKAGLLAQEKANGRSPMKRGPR